jgi:DNA-directed RNA polymerase subunit M/transcription elongation factor TFIIS
MNREFQEGYDFFTFNRENMIKEFNNWNNSFPNDKNEMNNFELCPKCMNKSLRSINLQLRSLDEGQTNMKKCYKCDYKYYKNS